MGNLIIAFYDIEKHSNCGIEILMADIHLVKHKLSYNKVIHHLTSTHSIFLKNGSISMYTNNSS